MEKEKVRKNDRTEVGVGGGMTEGYLQPSNTVAATRKDTRLGDRTAAMTNQPNADALKNPRTRTRERENRPTRQRENELKRSNEQPNDRNNEHGARTRERTRNKFKCARDRENNKRGERQNKRTSKKASTPRQEASHVRPAMLAFAEEGAATERVTS